MTVTILRLLELLEEPGQLCYVPAIDHLDLVDHLLVAEVMGQIMVALGNSNLREGPITTFAGKQQSGNAGGIGLEGNHKHIEHELDVFVEVRWDAEGSVNGRIGGRHLL